jgi:chromatin remodeling complex protein RSC6
MCQVWEYVKENNLQNPSNKKEIFPNADLKAVFGQDSVGFTEVILCQI